MLSKSKILMAKDGVLLTWSNREKKEVSANMVIFLRHAENNGILSKYSYGFSKWFGKKLYCKSSLRFNGVVCGYLLRS